MQNICWTPAFPFKYCAKSNQTFCVSRYKVLGLNRSMYWYATLTIPQLDDDFCHLDNDTEIKMLTLGQYLVKNEHRKA